MVLLLFSSAADEELFEDNPEEYIRRDIEGSGNVKNMEILTHEKIAVINLNFYHAVMRRPKVADRMANSVYRYESKFSDR